MTAKSIISNVLKCLLINSWWIEITRLICLMKYLYEVFECHYNYRTYKHEDSAYAYLKFWSYDWWLFLQIQNLSY